jgi:hypothetical protein
MIMFQRKMPDDVGDNVHEDDIDDDFTTRKIPFSGGYSVTKLTKIVKKTSTTTSVIDS